MNAERLHAIALAIRTDLNETKALDTLRALLLSLPEPSPTTIVDEASGS